MAVIALFSGTVAGKKIRFGRLTVLASSSPAALRGFNEQMPFRYGIWR